MTVKDALDNNKGVGAGFHWLRHALSVGIVAHHCRAAIYYSITAGLITAGVITERTNTFTGYSWPSGVADYIRPSLFSLVGMFFALSGFLVMGSALRNPSIKVFFANRALRIIPALSVEVILSACILGPICTRLSLSRYFADPLFFRYFGNIVGHVSMLLPGVFADLPWPNVVNGNLWTLPPEFWCYAVMMSVILLSLLRQRRYLLIALGVFLAAATIAEVYDPTTFSVRGRNQYVQWYVVTMFWIGALAFLYADRIPIRLWMFLVSIAAFWITIVTGVFSALSGVFLCYVMLYLGMLDWKWWNRNIKADHSYGIYLYGFPLMQTIIHFWQPHYGGIAPAIRVILLFAATLTTTLIFAELSWRFIEKPALGLRHRFARTPKPAAGVSDA